ncbi:peptidase U32 family protein [Vagococcus silagei]|uniref:U32 family peptidase n=1 Tax=Vagococcus silagei TaxID=2508885 RepID=A0A4S3B1A6_9ENTE|nr:peptidase U32 family protein [Vagococcus silagei]THB60552.1 U32 family peptidase [Vagococcus silagei]
MIEIIATIESTEQAKQLLDLGIDGLYFGEERYGLRLPRYFSREEMHDLVTLIHEYGKKARVSVNAIMHPEDMEGMPEYLAFLEEIGVDEIIVGDAGVIFVLQRDGYHLPYIYDTGTTVTSSRQINFWAKRGASGAVLAREIPFKELELLSRDATIPTEFLVYGATCIHQSKRPLLENYFSFIKTDQPVDKEQNLFITEPKDEDSHYSIFEDRQGTHIFQTNDINMMLELAEVHSVGLNTWKLDGIYTPGDDFVKIAEQFIIAKNKIMNNEWSVVDAEKANEVIHALHPKNRGLDQGFYYLNPDEIR